MIAPEIHAAAEQYVAVGWRILPVHVPGPTGCSCGKADCGSPGKHPRQSGWTELVISPEVFANGVRHNIGIVTGAASGNAVIDVDAGGEATLAELERKHGPLPATVAARTGGGGRHIHFKHPGFPIKNDVKRRLGPGLDVRGDGGFVVAPPSLHASGNYYEWLPGLAPWECKLAEMPAWLVELLTEPARPAPPPRPASRPAGGSRERRYAAGALANACEAVAGASDGTRNNVLNQEAFSIGQLVGGALLGRRVAEQQLGAAAAEAGLSESEIQKTLQSALAAGEKQPRGAPAEKKRPHSPRSREPGEDDGEDEAPSAVRPSIDIGVDMKRVVAEALEALTNDVAVEIYQRGRELVHVLRQTAELRSGSGIPRLPEAPFIAVLPETLLQLHMSACAEWLKLDKRSNRWVPSLPPSWAASALHGRGMWPGIPRLEGITETPMLRVDGTVLELPGYDPASGFFLAPNGSFRPVKEMPTLDEARAACAELLEIVQDFPFASAAHKSAWLAALLTPLARAAIDGSIPGFLFDANARASGKGLLADINSIILTGRPLARMTMPVKDEELRKVLFALALEGEQLVFMDEARVLSGAALDAALTGTRMKDRVLGESKNGQAPILFTLYFAGNNVQVKGDTVRRILPIRLESACERPEERTDFVNANLRLHVRQDRARFHCAALTILRGYCAAGRPDQKLPQWGSFEEWSNLVRSALVWAGQEDPCATRLELADTDTDAALLRQLIVGLEELGGGPLTVREIMAKLDVEPSVAPTMRVAFAELDDSEKPTAKKLGNRLRKFKGRVVGGKKLDCVLDRNGIGRWKVVVSAGSAGSAGSSTNPPRGSGDD